MCIGTTSINTRTCSRRMNAFDYSAVMPPRHKRSCITVLREYHCDDVNVNDTPVAVAVEAEEIISSVVTTSIRRGCARSSKRQRFEKEGDRLVEKPIDAATPPTLMTMSTSKI